MVPIKKAFSSTIGQKFLMAITGLALVLFLVFHLLGNLPLLLSDGTKYNVYSNTLITLGTLLYIAEVGLLVLTIIHILLAILLRYKAVNARPINYQTAKSKMGPSKMGFASRNLIVTGLVLLVFIVVHLIQFKWGPGVAEGYFAEIDGKRVRDLYRVVHESFQNPINVLFYVGTLVFMIFHLKHGVWSSFQSLGATSPRTSNKIYSLGILIALLLGIGFIIIPLWAFFDLSAKLTGGHS
jgi:succinate dehydrogenase / fumarate reductase, cytochrome b subunit